MLPSQIARPRHIFPRLLSVVNALPVVVSTVLSLAQSVVCVPPAISLFPQRPPGQNKPYTHTRELSGTVPATHSQSHTPSQGGAATLSRVQSLAGLAAKSEVGLSLALLVLSSPGVSADEW